MGHHRPLRRRRAREAAVAQRSGARVLTRWPAWLDHFHSDRGVSGGAELDR
jgi:hypothetical protein